MLCIKNAECVSVCFFLLKKIYTNVFTLQFKVMGDAVAALNHFQSSLIQLLTRFSLGSLNQAWHQRSGGTSTGMTDLPWGDLSFYVLLWRPNELRKSKRLEGFRDQSLIDSTRTISATNGNTALLCHSRQKLERQGDVMGHLSCLSLARAGRCGVGRGNPIGSAAPPALQRHEKQHLPESCQSATNSRPGWRPRGEQPA